MNDKSLTNEKPLFIPLKTEYYRAFESGEKRTEYRLYGPRWNEKTCRVGRKVVLSLGYGKKERLTGTVIAFTQIDPRMLDTSQIAAVLALYGTLNKKLAAISIELSGEQPGKSVGVSEGV